MKLVVISDIHDGGITTGDDGFRHVRGPRLLLARVVKHIERFIQPDAVVVLGDLVEDGGASDAADRYLVLREILSNLRRPWVVLPGNHDAPVDLFYRFFPRPPEILEIGSVRIVPFWDAFTPDHQAIRSPADLARSRTASAGWPGPVVALHHVPLFAPGTHACPYNYVNAAESLDAYRLGGITVSLAGHYHEGFGPLMTPAGWSLAVPALSVPPFRFWEVHLRQGRAPTVREHRLRLPEGWPWAESHVHSELAYCAADITIEAAQEVGRLIGVEQVGFAEHTGQLYFDRDTFWNAIFMSRGLDTAVRGETRIAQYLSRMQSAGVPRAHTGFEVDFDFAGRPVLMPEHREAAGFLIGSYHWTPETAVREPFDSATCAARHREVWDRMLPSGIDVLGHPFRIWNLAGVSPPRDLFPELAERLRASGVAAELNFHVEEPSREFAVQCLERGVRFALGTDSHSLVDVGDFWPHLRFLEGLGVGPRDWDRVLWRPGLNRN